MDLHTCLDELLADDRDDGVWPVVRTVGWLAGLLGVGYVLHAATRDNRRIQVRRYDVRLPNLPETCHGLTIVQMTDFHQGPWMEEEYMLGAIGLSVVLQPDLIVLTGDYVTRSGDYASVVDRCLKHLRAPQGVFGVLGNHDHHEDRAPQVEAALKDSGLTVMTNQNQKLECGLWLAGIDDWTDGQPDYETAMEGIPEDEPVLLLSHNPSAAHLAQDRNCVILAGHTHGGQIGTPRLIPKAIEDEIETKEFDLPVAEGWYDLGRAMVYVNRGLGMGELRLRFWQRPEIALFTLMPDGDGGPKWEERE